MITIRLDCQKATVQATIFFFFRNHNSYIDYIKLSQDTILINLNYFRSDMLVQLRSVGRQSGVLELD